jgi:hypothetical protein
MGFNDSIFDRSSSLGKFSSRYALPVLYPDNGGFLLPLYVSNVYLSIFTHTIIDFTTSSAFQNSRTIFGSGLHLRFKISNLAFELGAGVVYDPVANNFDYIIGAF